MKLTSIRGKSYKCKQDDLPDIETIPPFKVKKGLSDWKDKFILLIV